MFRTVAAVSLALLASACAGGSGASTAPRVAATTPSIDGAFRQPAVMRGNDVESIIGERAGSLTSRFGDARIDLSEGDARKLQFVSDRCVLDIYLYPLSANADPVATHIEARERRGGRETDRAGCIAEVEIAANAR